MPDKAPAIQISTEQADELCQRVLWCIQSAEDALSTYRTTVKDQRELFNPRPEREDPPWDGACELHVNRCEWVVQQIKARTRNALFDVDPVFKTEPRAQEDREEAAAVERFGQLLLTEYMDATDDLLRACEGGLRDGSEAVYQRWRREVKDRTTWQTVEEPATDTEGNPVGTYWLMDPTTGMPLQEIPSGETAGYDPSFVSFEPKMRQVRKGKREPVVTYDGPEFVRVEVTRVGTYPAANSDVERSNLLFLRYSESWDTILHGMNEGYYDRKAIEFLRQQTPETGNLATAEDTQREIEATVDSSRTKQWEPLDLVEAWVGYTPLPDSKRNEDPDKQDLTPSQEYLVTLHEQSRTVLRAIPNPRWDGKRPVEMIMPLDARFGVHGISVPDLAGRIQETESGMVQRMFDRMDRDLRPPMAIQKGALTDGERHDLDLQNKPGGVLEVHEPKELQWLRDPSSSAGAVLQILQWANDLGQRVSGTVDPQLGVSPPGQRTLGEVQITTSQASMLDQMKIRNVARSLARLWRLTLSSVYQCIDHESMQELWSRANPNDPIAEDVAQMAVALAMQGLPEPQIQQQLSLTGAQIRSLLHPELLPGEYELSRDYKVTCWGVAEDANRMENRQKWMNVGPLLMQDPDIMSDPRRLYAAKSDFYTALGLDATRYLGEEEEFIAFKQQQAQMLMAQQQQQMEQQTQQEEMQMQSKERDRKYQQEDGDRAHQQKLEQIGLQQALKGPVGAGRAGI